MPLCVSCGESIPPGMGLCPMCGNAMSSQPSSNTIMEALQLDDDVIEGIPIAESRQCAICQKTYDASYPDVFCDCGGQLIDAPMLTALPIDDSLDETILTAQPIDDSPDEPTLTAQPIDEALEATRTEYRLDATVEDAPTEPRRLVLYGEDKNPIANFPIDKDVTLIGRLDAVDGVFPDIDIREWVSANIARRVSRKHALVLRSRKDNVIRLRALPGNTGTQIDGELVKPLTDHILTPGRRIILGGAVRLKYEENGPA